MPFTFTKLEIPEVILIKPQLFHDNRGYFAEVFKDTEFKKNGINHSFVQDNHSKSKKGVLRGLHYQKMPIPQGKLVQVIHGSIFDVAVDLRQGSPTYGKWVSAILSAENHHMLWVPPGFAHGFLSLEDNTDVMYKVTNEFKADLDRSLRWNDPKINVEWPLKNPELSEKDKAAPAWNDADNNFTYEQLRG